MGRMDAELAAAFDATLPPWLIDELPRWSTRLRSRRPRSASDSSIVLADRNWRAGNGGPFAAIVVDATSGALISVGVNVVLASGLSAMHAEMMALSLAQRALGRWDLGADGAELELVVNWRPCVMCFGATMWSGVRALTIAGEGAEVERLTGFDEGPMPADWVGEFERRGIRVSIGLGHDDAIEVFRAFGDVRRGRVQRAGRERQPVIARRELDTRARSPHADRQRGLRPARSRLVERGQSAEHAARQLHAGAHGVLPRGPRSPGRGRRPCARRRVRRRLHRRGARGRRDSP